MKKITNKKYLSLFVTITLIILIIGLGGISAADNSTANLVKDVNIEEQSNVNNTNIATTDAIKSVEKTTSNIEQNTKNIKKDASNTIYANSQGSGDGSTIETPTNIDDALRNVEDEGTIVLVTNGNEDSDEYELSSAIQISSSNVNEAVSKFTITGQENKNIILSASITNNIFEINDGLNITLKNLNILNGKYGVLVNNGHLNLINNTLSDSYNNAVHILGDSTSTIINNTFANSGNTSVYLDNVNALIENNAFTVSTRNILNITKSNVNIINNTISGSKANAVFARESIIVLNDNIISNSGTDAINLTISNATINNNTITSSYSSAIELTNKSNANITNNNIRNTTRGSGIYLYTNSTGTISNNNISNVYSYGIYSQTRSHANITNNIIVNATRSSGIYVYSNAEVLIKNNTVLNSAGDGAINLNQYVNATVINNIISNATVGLRVYSYTYAIVENNLINNTSNYGIWVNSYSNATINNNNITNSKGTSSSFSSVYIYSRSNAELNDNLIENSSNIGVYVYTYSNATINNNTINNTDGYTIYVQQLSNANITNNTLLNSDSDSIFLSTNVVVDIINNTIINATNYAAIDIEKSNATIINNTIKDIDARGIYLREQDHVYIESNILENIAEEGIDVQEYSTADIINNTVNNTGENAIYVYYYVNSTVINNTVTNSNETGIFLYDYVNATVTNNTVINTTGNGGIYVYARTNAILENNTIINATSGVSVYYTASATLINNTISNLSEYGVYVRNYTTKSSVVLKDNIITSSKISALYIEDPSIFEAVNNTIANNTVSESLIYIPLSSDNTNFVFESNNIINNEASSDLINITTVKRNQALVLSKNNIINNAAETAILNNTKKFGSLELNENNIINNTAEIIIDNYATLIVTDNLFVNNTNGNDILLHSEEETITVSGNTYIDNALNDELSYVLNDDNTVDVTLTLNPIYNDLVRNGTITVVINDEEVDVVDVVDSTASISLDVEKLTQNENNVELKYNTLSNHYQNATVEFTVTVKPYNVEVTVVDNTYENVIIDVKVADEDTQPLTDIPVTITLPDESTITVETNEEGIATFTPELDIGENDIIITIPSTEDYTPYTSTQTVNVISPATVITANIINNTVGNVIIEVSVVDSETNEAVTEGYINITDDSEQLYARGELTQDSIRLTPEINIKGTYTLIINFEGNDLYIANNTVLSDINIIAKQATLEAEVKESNIENTIIEIVLKDSQTQSAIENAQVNIILPDETTQSVTTDTEGNAQISLTLPVGENSISIVYEGNDLYDLAQTSVDVTIEKLESNINVEVTNNKIGEAEITVGIIDALDETPITTGTLTVEINDQIINTPITGEETVIPLDIDTKGTYDITVTYEESEKYTESSATTQIEIIAKTVTITTEIIENSISKTVIEITLTDEENNLLANEDILVTINNQEVQLTTDTEGKAQYEAKLDIGQYTVSIKFEGNDEYDEAIEELDLTVSKTISVITIDEFDVIPGEKTLVTVHVTDENGNAINSGKVVLKVNGVSLKDENGKIIYVTVNNGVATFEYNVPATLKEGSKIQAVYSGSNQIESSKTEEATINITKPEPTITSEDVSGSVGQTVAINAKIEGVDNINSGKVAVKINGKTLKDENGKVIYAKIENGVVSIDYTIPSSLKPKDYTITIIYTAANNIRVEQTTTLTVQ